MHHFINSALINIKIHAHLQDLKIWTLTPAQLKAVNDRSNDLGGEPNWVPPALILVATTFKLKAVGFVWLSRGAMTYVFEGVFDGQETESQKQAFESFNESLRLLLTTHFNADGKPHTERTKRLAAALLEQVVQTMSLLEMCCPLILFDRLLHELLHVPTALLKWNSCRNYWAFKSERYNT